MILSLVYSLVCIFLGLFLTTFLNQWIALSLIGFLFLLAIPLSKKTAIPLRLGSLSLAYFAPLVWMGVLVFWYFSEAKEKTSVQPSVALRRQVVEANAFVNKTHLVVEKDKLIYTLQVVYPKKISLSIPKITAHPTFHGSFILPADSPPQIKEINLPNDVVKKEWKLTLVPVQTGPLEMPSWVFKYKVEDKLHKVRVPSIAIDVSELKKIDEELKTLHAGFSPILPESPEEQLNGWIAGLTAGGIVVSLFFFFLFWKKEKEPEVEIDPHIWFEKQMEKLHSANYLEKQENKAHFFQASENFRGYLERRFRFPALESTSEEIQLWMKNNKEFSRDLTDDIRKVLLFMDDIKFAGIVPSSKESSDCNNRMFSIVRRSLPQEKIQEPHTPKEEV